ncbi:MAG: hypothetical protein N2260_05330 [Syntrophobacterales bacterium]|nr:hypothetical protein [Syntrophobacterales bacterium]
MRNPPRIAKLKPEEIEAIQRLEEKLGNRFCLLAVEKAEKLYVIEAKIAPNLWERIDKVYPQLEGLKPYYDSEEDARLAKASIKSLLSGKLKGSLEKRPIRIRKL